MMHIGHTFDPKIFFFLSQNVQTIYSQQKIKKIMIKMSQTVNITLQPMQ